MRRPRKKGRWGLYTTYCTLQRDPMTLFYTARVDVDQSGDIGVGKTSTTITYVFGPLTTLLPVYQPTYGTP